MYSILRRCMTGAVACIALAGAFSAAPAKAQASPQRRPTMMLITIGPGEDSTSITRAVTLRCNPTGGTHPAAATACGQLDAVAGRFSALPGESIMCYQIYQPVTVTVLGLWRGRLVYYRETFPNSCVAVQRGGAVFKF